MIIAGGVLVGFFGNSRSAPSIESLGTSAGSSFAPSLQTGVASPVDSSFGFGNAVSSATVVQGGATVINYNHNGHQLQLPVQHNLARLSSNQIRQEFRVHQRRQTRPGQAVS